MRVLLAVTLLVFGSAGVIAGDAVDDLCVVARPNRLTPLRYQHYYPISGVKPKVGRAEDLLAPSSAPEPEKTYRRNY
jgi:hypothetical protein